MYVLEPTALYAAADEASDKIVELAIADSVEREAVDGSWAQVEVRGKEGYVLAAMLTEDKAKASEAKAAAEEAAAAEAEAAAAAEAAAKAQAEAEAAAAARAQAEAEAAAAAQAQAEAEAAAAAQAKAEAEAAAKAASGSSQSSKSAKSGDRTVVSKEYVPPCDGHADGYTVITYSDGTEELVEGKA